MHQSIIDFCNGVGGCAAHAATSDKANTGSMQTAAESYYGTTEPEYYYPTGLQPVLGKRRLDAATNEVVEYARGVKKKRGDG